MLAYLHLLPLINPYHFQLQNQFGDFSEYTAGVPTSLIESGQQWDYPNAWPPLQHMWIVGLAEAGDEELKKLGENLANKWVVSNWKKWLNGHHMYEKVKYNWQNKVEPNYKSATYCVDSRHP